MRLKAQRSPHRLPPTETRAARPSPTAAQNGAARQHGLSLRGSTSRPPPHTDLLEWKRCSGSVRWQDESWQPKSLTSRHPSSLRLPPRGGCWCERSGHGSSGARNFSYSSSVMAAAGERAPHAHRGRAAGAAMSGRWQEVTGRRRGGLLPPRRHSTAPPAAPEAERRPTRGGVPGCREGPHCHGGGGGGQGGGSGLRARRKQRRQRRLPGAAGAGRGRGDGPRPAGSRQGDLPPPAERYGSVRFARQSEPALRASDAGKGVPFGGRHRREPRGWREAALCPPLRRAAVFGRAPMSSPAFRCHVFHSSLYSTRIAYSSGCRPSSSSLGCSPGRGQRSCTEAAGPRKVVVVCQRGHDPRGKVFVTALRL